MENGQKSVENTIVKNLISEYKNCILKLLNIEEQISALEHSKREETKSKESKSNKNIKPWLSGTIISLAGAVAFGVIAALINPLFAIGAGVLGIASLGFGGKSIYNAVNNNNKGENEPVKSDKDR